METRREFVHAGPGRLALAASHLHLYLSLSLSLFPAAFPAVRRHAEAA
ncbi:hypothetical protein J7F01_33950 [Streptomyces sp. ISL-22]|nr:MULTISPECIES: hypothetical protein [unclassified Streptomyces]MBT2421249.1 hypothetical protein [Streptomyces sp. ISL-24]MBT2437076.1 hypothetical protein [Streptomyces sp. ISL-22]